VLRHASLPAFGLVAAIASRQNGSLRGHGQCGGNNQLAAYNS
jgi:hypothetical protein